MQAGYSQKVNQAGAGERCRHLTIESSAFAQQ
jgi:hypothetical protein